MHLKTQRDVWLTTRVVVGLNGGLARFKSVGNTMLARCLTQRIVAVLGGKILVAANYLKPFHLDPEVSLALALDQFWC